MTVALHALSDEHIPQVVDACADWEELAQYGPPYWRPRSSAELRRKVAATAGPQPATEYTFVLMTPDNRMVGECSLHAIDWRNRVGQVGVCIWRPADRGKGYGQAGVRETIKWAFEYLDLARLEAWIVAGNERSLQLFRGLGFVDEGTLRQRYRCAGKAHDMHVLARLAESNVAI